MERDGTVLPTMCFMANAVSLRQRYHQGQEDQLGVLGLVVNMIVLWNTWYIQDALDELRNSGQEVQLEDVERLAPLRFASSISMSMAPIISCFQRAWLKVTTAPFVP